MGHSRGGGNQARGGTRSDSLGWRRWTQGKSGELEEHTALPWGVTVLQDHPLPALAAALGLMGHRGTGLPIPSPSLSANPPPFSALHMLLLDKSGLIQPRPKAFSFLQTHSFFTHPFLCSLLQLPTLIPPLPCKLILQELTDPFSLLSLHLAKAFSITHTKASLVLAAAAADMPKPLLFVPG